MLTQFIKTTTVRTPTWREVDLDMVLSEISWEGSATEIKAARHWIASALMQCSVVRAALVALDGGTFDVLVQLGDAVWVRSVSGGHEYIAHSAARKWIADALCEWFDVEKPFTWINAGCPSFEAGSTRFYNSGLGPQKNSGGLADDATIEEVEAAWRNSHAE